MSHTKSNHTLCMLQNNGFSLDSQQVWASIDRYQRQASPTDPPSPRSSSTAASTSTTSTSRLDRRLAIDFLLNPSSASSSPSSPTPEPPATADREVRCHHPQPLATTKQRRSRHTSPSPRSSPLLSSPDGPTSSPLPSAASSDCTIDRPRHSNPKRLRRVSKLPAMGLGLLDVPDLSALASAQTDTTTTVVVGDQTAANQGNKRAAKPSTSASRALQPGNTKRARTNSPTTTDCHHRSQGQATKRRRTKTSTPPNTQW